MVLKVPAFPPRARPWWLSLVQPLCQNLSFNKLRLKPNHGGSVITVSLGHINPEVGSELTFMSPVHGLIVYWTVTPACCEVLKCVQEHKFLSDRIRLWKLICYQCGPASQCCGISAVIHFLLLPVVSFQPMMSRTRSMTVSVCFCSHQLQISKRSGCKVWKEMFEIWPSVLTVAALSVGMSTSLLCLFWKSSKLWFKTRNCWHWWHHILKKQYWSRLTE